MNRTTVDSRAEPAYVSGFPNGAKLEPTRCLDPGGGLATETLSAAIVTVERPLSALWSSYPGWVFHLAALCWVLVTSWLIVLTQDGRSVVQIVGFAAFFHAGDPRRGG